MKKTKKILKGFGNGVIIILLVIMVILGISTIQARRNPNQIPSVMGFSPMSVLSGSMRPMLDPGDMIITKRPTIENIDIGDVITYRVGANTLVTHRVIDIIIEDDGVRFQTQGDANNTIDQSLVAPEEIVGTYVFRIPQGGYIANFARSPFGFILLILLPVALLIGNELKTSIFKAS
ncbi:MAG: signal peptidase I [Clostridiaceae bacterium]|nr:signal peptidase I [Clostridiaceae bacterium]